MPTGFEYIGDGEEYVCRCSIVLSFYGPSIVYDKQHVGQVSILRTHLPTYMPYLPSQVIDLHMKKAPVKAADKKHSGLLTHLSIFQV